MKKIVLLLVYIFFIKNICYGQIQISLDTIKLSDISYKSHNGVWSILFNRNTESIFYITLINNSDSIVEIKSSELKLFYHYIYKNKIYIRDLFLSKNENKSISIYPHNLMKIEISNIWLANFTPFDQYKNDYNKEFAQLIPTLRVFLIQNNNSIIISEPLKNIKIRKKHFQSDDEIEYGNKNFIFELRLKFFFYRNKTNIPNIIYY